VSDRFTVSFEAAVRRIFGQRIDFLAAYPARVVKQNADGTLELFPDYGRLPTYKNVPIRYGVPGVTATIAAGGRVLLEFAGGDPQRPIATVWESASVTLLTITASAIKLGGSGASHPLIFGDDFSSAGTGSAFDTLMQAVATAVGTSGSPAGATAAATAIVSAITAYQTAVLAKLSANTTA
jgi:hypothetical protein